MGITANITTAEQLLAAGDIGRCELIRGELIHMSPSGSWHSILASRISGPLATFVKAHDLGEVFTADGGFVLTRNPDTVVAPDGAFVAKARLKIIDDGYFNGAPDIAIEVISPSDRAADIDEKVQDYLDAGCRLVWLVSPRTKSINVYRHGSSQSTVLKINDKLTGEDVVPGFELALSHVFER